MIPEDNDVPVALSDNDLLMRIAEQQDRDAFAQLFKSIAPRIKAYMMKLGASPDTAEEISQESLITVWRKAGQFDRQKSSAVTWIFTIARNLRVDRLRKENRPALDPNEPLLVPDNPRSPLAEFEESTVVDRVTAAIEKLPSDQQEAIRLSFIEGLSHGEISERLNVPLGTIKSRLRLAFEKLRFLLGDIR
jgi:RNA polymerase sigma-70 factor, ECF subfamily